MKRHPYRIAALVSLGLVMVEELTGSGTPAPKVWLVYAKLLQQAGQSHDAKEAYDKAVALDPNLKDAFLESELNLAVQKGREPEKMRLHSQGEDGEPGDEDRVLDIERPKVNFADVGGMESVKREISLKIIEPLKHADLYKAYGKKIGGGILLYGPPGLGKTTLANIIANEMNSAIKITAGPSIERPGDLAAIVTNLRAGDILFIDEVHRLNRSVEEILYPAMEDFALDLITGKGPSARSIRLKLPRFTIVGATTRFAMLSAPLPSGTSRRNVSASLVGSRS